MFFFVVVVLVKSGGWDLESRPHLIKALLVKMIVDWFYMCNPEEKQQWIFY